MELILLLVCCISFGLLLAVFWLVGRTNSALIRMEHKIGLLLAYSGVDESDFIAAELEPFIQAGRKIEAIKLYRAMTGAGQEEATAVVEKLLNR